MKSPFFGPSSVPGIRVHRVAPFVLEPKVLGFNEQDQRPLLLPHHEVPDG